MGHLRCSVPFRWTVKTLGDLTSAPVPHKWQEITIQIPASGKLSRLKEHPVIILQ